MQSALFRYLTFTDREGPRLLFCVWPIVARYAVAYQPRHSCVDTMISLLLRQTAILDLEQDAKRISSFLTRLMRDAFAI